jgi:hypothetical protein
MATGRSNHLTKQIGEYLVAAELGRRGFIAATFSGNVPDYDIVATDAHFKSFLVQVKAINGSSWQLDIRRFVSVSLDGNKQILGARITAPRTVICIMVALSEYGSDRFYVLEWSTLQDILVRGYEAYLKRRDGVRPKKFDSYHTVVNEEQLAAYKDNWALLNVAAELMRMISR